MCNTSMHEDARLAWFGAGGAVEWQQVIGLSYG